MKLIFKFLPIIACFVLLSINLIAQDIPEYFKGEIIGEGKKAEWLPDGSAISYVNNDVFYLYDIAKGKSKKLVSMKVAQYQWLSNDSALVIEWPENVTEKKRVKKIVNYWIIQCSGEKSIFAADTLMTRKIPKYNTPFHLPDGSIALKKSSGWQKYDLPQTDKYIAFNTADYDLAKFIADYRFVTASRQEGGSIHFKDINKVNDKTLVLGKNYHMPVLSPDYGKVLAHTSEGIDVIHTDEEPILSLQQYLTDAEYDNLDKFFGAGWNNKSDGFVYYELYDIPQDFVNISYFDLNKKKRMLLSQSFYYGNQTFRFSPDDKSILAMMDYNEISYIALLHIPENKPGEAK
jgi:hypothetical protein